MQRAVFCQWPGWTWKRRSISDTSRGGCTPANGKTSVFRDSQQRTQPLVLRDRCCYKWWKFLVVCYSRNEKWIHTSKSIMLPHEIIFIFLYLVWWKGILSLLGLIHLHFIWKNNCLSIIFKKYTFSLYIMFTYLSTLLYILVWFCILSACMPLQHLYCCTTIALGLHVDIS